MPLSRLWRDRRRIWSEVVAEVIGHQLDLLGGPQRAAADHPIEIGLPRARILPLVAPHRVGMALEACGLDDFEALMRRRRLLRADRRRQQQQWRECRQERTTDAHSSPPQCAYDCSPLAGALWAILIHPRPLCQWANRASAELA